MERDRTHTHAHRRHMREDAVGKPVHSQNRDIIDRQPGPDPRQIDRTVIGVARHVQFRRIAFARDQFDHHFAQAGNASEVGHHILTDR